MKQNLTLEEYFLTYFFIINLLRSLLRQFILNHVRESLIRHICFLSVYVLWPFEGPQPTVISKIPPSIPPMLPTIFASLRAINLNENACFLK